MNIIHIYSIMFPIERDVYATNCLYTESYKRCLDKTFYKCILTSSYCIKDNEIRCTKVHFSLKIIGIALVFHKAGSRKSLLMHYREPEDSVTFKSVI